METCVLMGSFDKYMVFETQFYEIWESDFNMKNNVVFMHSGGAKAIVAPHQSIAAAPL